VTIRDKRRAGHYGWTRQVPHRPALGIKERCWATIIVLGMAKAPTRLDAEEARATAARCLANAKLATSVEQRVMLLDMAAIWERIAGSLESDQSARLG
jgi:hypothetical protein